MQPLKGQRRPGAHRPARPDETLRSDPAPSRLRYRMHRLMLTPRFRFALRVGLPLGLMLAVGAGYFADQDRRDAVRLAIADLRASIEERPEFMVELMAIDGARDQVAEDIREILPIDFPTSSFDLDLDLIRQEVTGLDAVERATVRIRPGGVLQIDVTERVPAVVWRGPRGLELLDQDGNRVGPVFARSARPDLPLIVGRGADEAASEGLVLVAAAEPLKDRLRGLVRMGERRWDVVLDRDQRIMLPAKNPVQALERAIALDQAQDLLARDLAAVDLRNPRRPTLRMTQNAVQELWRIKNVVETADGDETEPEGER
ncbi:FtsQ-type POTRA domain-containing protein [Aquicoccus sp. SCR17]|nr:FtsQ-type POTRA domain-containing protein [Carideicomes alvinocaridis]